MKTYCECCKQDEPEVVTIGVRWICRRCYETHPAYKPLSEKKSFDQSVDEENYDDGADYFGE